MRQKINIPSSLKSDYGCALCASKFQIRVQAFAIQWLFYELKAQKRGFGSRRFYENSDS
jgi:hypothetical protein